MSSPSNPSLSASSSSVSAFIITSVPPSTCMKSSMDMPCSIIMRVYDAQPIIMKRLMSSGALPSNTWQNTPPGWRRVANSMLS